MPEDAVSNIIEKKPKMTVKREKYMII
jgi:hypothetical protein